MNPFLTNVSLLYPLTTSENWRFSDVFRGYRSGTLVETRLTYNGNIKGSKIDPCSTPQLMFGTLENWFLILTFRASNWLNSQRKTFDKISWFMVSKVLCKSIRTNPVKRQESKLMSFCLNFITFFAGNFRSKTKAVHLFTAAGSLLTKLLARFKGYLRYKTIFLQ